jgi:hypothetical protein
MSFLRDLLTDPAFWTALLTVYAARRPVDKENPPNPHR